MKLRLDIPNQFAVESYADYTLTRDTYTRIIQAALRIDIPIEISRARLTGQTVNVQTDDEIRYTFHAEQMGEQVYCLKASALPRFWYFDPCGYGGWSKIAGDIDLQESSKKFDLARARVFIRSYRKDVAGQNTSKLKQSDAPLEPAISGLKDFIFLPLQVDHDRVLIHLPWEQSETLQRVMALAETHDRPVVIKRHPLCKSDAVLSWLDTARQARNIHVTDGSIHELITRSSAVLVANSGVGLEALLHGKPVYSMAKSEYRHMTRAIRSLNDLEMVFTESHMPQTETIERQLGFLFLEYLVDCNCGASIEARIQQHMQAHPGSDAVAKVRKKNQIKNSETLLLNRSKTELAMSAELLLKTAGHLSDAAQKGRADLLSRIAALGIKRKLILAQGGPDVWLQVAMRLLKIEDYSDATQFAEAAAKLTSHEGRARVILAQLALKAGQEETAIAELRRSIACGDAPEQSYLILAQRLFHQGPTAYDEAEKLARLAMEQNPQSFRPHLFFVRLESARGNHEAMQEHLNQAQTLAPDSAAVLKAVGKYQSSSAT